MASPLQSRDVQITMRYEDGSEFTFTVIRDHNMRWNGHLPKAPMVNVTAEWFDNPPLEEEPSE